MPSVLRSRHLARAKDLADRRYADPITVADMAKAAALSPAHFARSFHAEFGEPPHRYLLSRRLERAARLLRTTDWQIVRVCHAVGWASVGSFTSSFTRVYGQSPTAYRAANPPAVAMARIPECVYRTYARPQVRSSGEDGGRARGRG